MPTMTTDTLDLAGDRRSRPRPELTSRVRSPGASSASRSTRRGRPGPVGSPTRSRRSSTTSSPARPSSSASVAARRSGSSSGRPIGPPRGVEPRPIQERIRADGPLLPPLTLALAGWIADTYLAPPALVLRSMLPPGLLERLELVAERRPDAPDRGSVATASDPAAARRTRPGDPRPARRRPARRARPERARRPGGTPATAPCPGGAGRVDLDWTLLAATAGPRYERWLTITTEGLAVVRIARREWATARSAARAAAGRPARRTLPRPGRTAPRRRPSPAVTGPRRSPDSSAEGSSGAMSASDLAGRSAIVRRDRGAVGRGPPP